MEFGRNRMLDFKTLKARGVKFKDPSPVEAPFGITACFTDPDGNNLTLLQPSTTPPQAVPQAQQR